MYATFLGKMALTRAPSARPHLQPLAAVTAIPAGDTVHNPRRAKNPIGSTQKGTQDTLKKILAADARKKNVQAVTVRSAHDMEEVDALHTTKTHVAVKKVRVAGKKNEAYAIASEYLQRGTPITLGKGPQTVVDRGTTHGAWTIRKDTAGMDSTCDTFKREQEIANDCARKDRQSLTFLSAFLKDPSYNDVKPVRIRVHSLRGMTEPHENLRRLLSILHEYGERIAVEYVRTDDEHTVEDQKEAYFHNINAQESSLWPDDPDASDFFRLVS